MKFINRIGRSVGVLSDHIIGWLLLISVLLNIAQVFTRYVMNAPLSWTEEAVRYSTSTSSNGLWPRETSVSRE